MKKKFLLAMLFGLVLTSPVQSPPHKCGVCERVILENTTDIPVTHTFMRGSHEGFVVVLPGQTVTVDIVRCE